MNTTIKASFHAPDVLPQEVARFLASEILYGEIPPGTRLTEEEVAVRYGVSRSPAREAIRLLAAEGLLHHSSRRGVWVPPVTRADLREVQVCRIALEGMAVAEAAVRAGSAEVATMERELAAMAFAVAARDIKRYFEHNGNLRMLMIDAAKNATLRRLLEGIGKRAMRYRYIAYSQSPEVIQRSLEANRKLVKAIREHNAEKARALTENLIRYSWKVIEARLPTDAPALQDPAEESRQN